MSLSFSLHGGQTSGTIRLEKPLDRLIGVPHRFSDHQVFTAKHSKRDPLTPDLNSISQLFDLLYREIPGRIRLSSIRLGFTGDGLTKKN